jgi:crotonobetainyl-CoA:carnitine CoA-transferase CaiB-like acyl-CoA transferase
MEQALSDVKVLDLTHYVAGPYCTKLLSDYGAEVIKIERPGTGDGARRMGPFLGDDPHPEKSGLFLHLNTNKQGITLNLKTDTGIRIFKELVKDADILVENFAPRVMPDLGLDYCILEELNPRLVKTSISNFGQYGPYRDYKATEIVLFAMGPHMITEGEPDQAPLRYPGYKSQFLAGTHAATATMGAFFGGELTGAGQEVDVSIIECLSSLPEGAGKLMSYAFSGEEVVRTGHRNEGMYPLGYFPCKDGVIHVFGFTPAQWPRIAQWMEMPELLEDPRFIDPVKRPEHHDEFDVIFMEWLLDQTQQEVVRSGQENRIPVAPVNRIDDVLADPQFNARDAFVPIEHPVAGTVLFPNVPFKLPEVPSHPQQPAPTLGQHNREIYCDGLGYNDSDLVRLRAEGVI